MFLGVPWALGESLKVTPLESCLWCAIQIVVNMAYNLSIFTLYWKRYAEWAVFHCFVLCQCTCLYLHALFQKKHTFIAKFSKKYKSTVVFCVLCFGIATSQKIFFSFISTSSLLFPDICILQIVKRYAKLRTKTL